MKKRKWPENIIEGLTNLKKNQRVLADKIINLEAQKEFELSLIRTIEQDLREESE